MLRLLSSRSSSKGSFGAASGASTPPAQVTGDIAGIPSLDKSRSSQYPQRKMLGSLTSGVVGKFIVMVFFITLLVCLGYYTNISDSVFRYNKDRAESYRVKILPSHLDDAALNELPPDTFSYVAMIDAGSSGCRSHVYRYGKLDSIDGPLYVVPKHNSKKVRPGLSSFAKHPQDAGASLSELVEFIKSQVPQHAWADTPIWLKATAGLRLLEKYESEAILVSVRLFLSDPSKSPFLFRNSYASIISGNEEGGFGWLSFNYLKKIIGPKKTGKETAYAVVEMGGASSQVSQIAPSKEIANAIPSANLFSFAIEGTVYDLYTHSYLGFGGEQARATLNKQLVQSSTSAAGPNTIEDPCLYPGYQHDSTSPAKDIYEGVAGPVAVVGSATSRGSCVSALKQLFAPSDPHQKCETSGPFSFKCVPQPDFVIASSNFLVFENFFHVASALQIPAVGSLSKTSSFPLITTPQLYEAASNKVCGLNVTEVNARYPLDKQPKNDNMKWCFMSAYAHAFLVDGLGLARDKPITVQQSVDGADIEWALGAAYKEVAQMMVRTNLRPT